MKKISFIFLLSFSFLGNTLNAQQLSLSWASYYGGAGTKVTAAQYDPVNNTVYICGVTTDSLGIATVGSHKPIFGPYATNLSTLFKKELFIARLDTAGNRIWATYFGGEMRTYIPSLSIDPAGNVYLSGVTSSLTGITLNGFYDTTPHRGAGFLTKFNPQGQQLWGSYYSLPVPLAEGTAHIGWRTAFDSAANVYLIAGTRVTQGVATPGSFQEQLDTAKEPTPPLPYFDWPYNGDAFLVKFDSSGTRLWGTYYGGENTDNGIAVYAEPSGNVFIAGITSVTSSSGNASNAVFVSPGAFLDTVIIGQSSGFLAKFDANGNRLWGTLIGGDDATYIMNIQGDAYGNIYVYGITGSSINIGTPGTHQPVYNGLGDAFLMKFNGAGQRIWGTYFGGSLGEKWVFSEVEVSPTNQTLIVTEKGGIYIAGGTTSLDDIATECTFEPSQGKGGYIAKFDTSGQLLMGSYYDAPISDISVDDKDNIYFSSWSALDSLATPGSFLSSKPLGQNAGIFGKFREVYNCPQDTIVLILLQDTLIADTGYLSYKWYQNGVLINTSSNHQFAISDSGSYYVVVEGSCNCLYTSSSIQTNGTGIVNWAKAMQLGISPNPADNYIIIQGKNNTTLLQYRIMDLLGKELLNGTIDPMKVIYKKLSLKNFVPGMYILQISNDKNKTNFKFLKN